MTARVSLIAARSENGVIGRDNKLPWRVKGDWAYFKRMTLGKPVVMGRKTFESLGKPLEDRPNFIVTRQHGYHPDGTFVFPSLETAVEAAKKWAQKHGVDEIFIGGGSEIYKLALEFGDRMYLTTIHCTVEGDTYFPAFNAAQWHETSRDPCKKEPGDTADYTIFTYDRIK